MEGSSEVVTVSLETKGGSVITMRFMEIGLNTGGEAS